MYFSISAKIVNYNGLYRTINMTKGKLLSTQTVTKKAPCGARWSKLGHHRVDLIPVNLIGCPADAIFCGLPINVVHAADELVVRCLILCNVFNTCLGSVVKPLLVLYPE